MHQPTIGSLFAGIGGFDVGFENAGYRTAWQVELNPINRAVLADRFPHARQFEDVRECGAHNLSAVDVITAGFPCQDISIAGSHAPRGLQGERSGLFWEVIRILKETQPRWVVLENVVNLLAVNDSRDFETVIRALADCGYVGFWRVLNAQYFGVPQQRRRVFLVAGYRKMPPIQLLADAAPVDAISPASQSQPWPRPADAWAANTLLANKAGSQISMGCTTFVAEPNGWDQMVERQRAAEDDGFCLGLDAANLAEAFGAGNAVVTQVAEWVGRGLITAQEPPHT
ncbi:MULTISPECIES: DNA cytosine methyltransferase [Pseudomonas]|uniref:Cytosine-specific methyltransferase n=1 Tax=Pseudomonas paracarnis TaxID=2750625 RepID=A0ABU6BWP2_9PSED|nr:MULTISPECIES: DNA (cytosine-5-)-methyltransferase [Pseudomonas]MBW9242055.1 DNA (cytosine-5-)-methyltransferase [Pseudomonas paracarnis]MEB3784171.1 DNA (cytosine-5-)-methyltransferase [Pseudomonas paracarnis]OJT28049.1 DNA (cytosine-5-)-methyltransferase [Pseudomonas sp. FSL W5-0203]